MDLRKLAKYRNKKVLVTGGLGFVGHNLVKVLVDQEAEVIVVDDQSNSTPEVLGTYQDKVEIVNISVLDPSFFKLLDGSINYIFHLACRTILTCGDDPIMDLQVNAQSTLLMLEHIRHNMPHLDNFVYTSSCSVYGSSKNLPAAEDGVKSTLSQYAATKLLGESYALMYNHLYDVPTASVRYSNVYGEGQSARNPYCGVIGKFIDLALKGEKLTVFGDGEQTRDYTYIDDAVNATLLVGSHTKAFGEVFNVATSREFSVNYLIDCIGKILGPQEVIHEPDRDIDNIRRRVIDIEKIQTKIRWTPMVGLEEGIERTIAWYRDAEKLKEDAHKS